MVRWKITFSMSCVRSNTSGLTKSAKVISSKNTNLCPGMHLNYDQRYIMIDKDSKSKMLFWTLLQLSGLLYLKYNFSRGIITKVCIKVDKIFHEDQDVVTHTDEFGNKSLLVNMCLDTGADLACGQHEFLGSAQFDRLSDKNLTIVTVLGNQKKTFKR